MQHREVADVLGEAVGEQHDDREDHGRRTDNRRADQHRFGRGLEGVASPDVIFEETLGLVDVEGDAEGFLDFLFDVGQLFDGGEFVDGLGVVSDRAVAVNGDGHRPHAEEAEGDQAKGEDGGHDAGLGRVGVDHGSEFALRDQVGAGHQADDDHAHPEGGEVACRQASEDVEAGAAFARGGDDFLDVAGVGRGEDFDHFGDDRAGQGAEGDDDRELPPQVVVDLAVDGDVADQQFGDEEGEQQGDDGGEPDQRGQGLFEVKVFGVLVLAFDDEFVAQIRNAGGDDHHDAHDEDPDQELDLYRGIGNSQEDEADQGDAGDAVGFEAVGGGANRIPRVVAGAVGDDAGVAGVVFLDLEDDFHEVRADVGDLGEDAAGDAQGGGAEGFADGEADEAFAGEFARDEEEDAEHDEEFGGDEHHADGDAGFHRDGVDRVGFAFERGEGGAAVGQGVDADAEPGDAEGASDADQREGQDQRDFAGPELLHAAEIREDDEGDEEFEKEQELALSEHVGLAGGIDQFAHLGHRAVRRQGFDLAIDHAAEGQAEQADEESGGKQLRAGQRAEKGGEGRIAELGENQVGFRRGLCRGG